MNAQTGQTDVVDPVAGGTDVVGNRLVLNLRYRTGLDLM